MKRQYVLTCRNRVGSLLVASVELIQRHGNCRGVWPIVRRPAAPRARIVGIIEGKRPAVWSASRSDMPPIDLGEEAEEVVLETMQTARRLDPPVGRKGVSPALHVRPEYAPRSGVGALPIVGSEVRSAIGGLVRGWQRAD